MLLNKSFLAYEFISYIIIIWYFYFGTNRSLFNTCNIAHVKGTKCRTFFFLKDNNYLFFWEKKIIIY